MNKEKKEVADKLNEKEQPNLIETLLKNSTYGLSTDTNGEYYYTGNDDKKDQNNKIKNYLWYGGHQWRVVSFNKSTDKKIGTLKLITQQPLTSISVSASNWTDASTYKETYVFNWLNDYFYKSLNSEVKSDIIETEFNIGKDNKILSNVGLLDKIEYERAGGLGSYLDIKDWWCLGNTNASSVLTVYGDGRIHYHIPSSISGIRAVITIPDIPIYDGDGSLEQNYKSKETINNIGNLKVGDYINIPYNGIECGIDKKCIFRIVSTDKNSAKLILNRTLPNESAYGPNVNITYNHDIYLILNAFLKQIKNKFIYSNTVEENLNSSFYRNFNIAMYGKGETYNLPEEKIISNVGLPVIGEMFSGNDIDLAKKDKNFVNVSLVENPFASQEYWVMNRLNDTKNQAVSDNSDLNGRASTELSGVRPVIFLKFDHVLNLPIISGDGSPNEPYEMK